MTSRVQQSVAARLMTLALAWGCVAEARADEGGVSFWLPGQMGSFAAVPGEPGVSVPLVYFHSSENANASKNFIIGGNRVAGLNANADLLFIAPTYTFTQALGGAQAAISLVWPVGRRTWTPPNVEKVK